MEQFSPVALDGLEWVFERCGLTVRRATAARGGY